MTKYSLNVTKRELTGKKLKALRRQGFLPGNVFGKHVDSLSVQARLQEFDKVFKDSGETSVVYLKVEGEDKDRPVLISNIHFDPISDQKLHVDFHQVNLKEKVVTYVPVELIGESEKVKDGVAIINQSLSDIEIEALPTDIPESITFDISSLKEIGDLLKVSDAKVSDSVVIKTDPEIAVVSLSEPQKEEVVEETPAEAESTESAEEAKPAESQSETEPKVE